jgi:NIMA (never in mitosis gene a)-related kinase
MRPDCDQILELPVVQSKIQHLFPEDFFCDSDEKTFNLLSTIRVPKNLLYLTDRLPKANYKTEEPSRREGQELLKRKTLNGGMDAPANGSNPNQS